MIGRFWAVRGGVLGHFGFDLHHFFCGAIALELEGTNMREILVFFRENGDSAVAR